MIFSTYFLDNEPYKINTNEGNYSVITNFLKTDLIIGCDSGRIKIYDFKSK